MDGGSHCSQPDRWWTSACEPRSRALVAIHRKYHPKADVEALDRAYAVAEKLHEGVVRKSGSRTSPTL